MVVERLRNVVWGLGLSTVVGVLGCGDANGAYGIVEDGEALIEGAPYPTRSLAFVLVDIGEGVNITHEAAMNRLVNAPASLRNFYLYGSYGRQDITAQTFGPFSYSMRDCSNSTTSNMATQLRRDHDIPDSQHYLWYIGSKTSLCGWSSLAEVGTPNRPANDSWYNATTSCLALVQGPSHNFGMQHSSSMRCPGVPFADDPNSACTHSEYGDVMDAMGGGCRHFNAWQKAHQGWLEGCNGVSVTSSGTFTLLPYERRCDGAQFLKVPMPKTRMFQRSGGGGSTTNDALTHYYVELRTPLDFDGSLSPPPPGLTPRVLIHVSGDLRARDGHGLHTWLLDMTPATTTFADAGLAQGQTFTDPAGGLTIAAQSVSATQATIVVTSTGSGAPTCLDGSTFATPGPGPEACVDNPATPVP